MNSGNQLPDPCWARDLVDGDYAEAQNLQAAITELGELFGEAAAQDCIREMKKITGKAMLRKYERDNPHWDGNTRIV